MCIYIYGYLTTYPQGLSGRWAEWSRVNTGDSRSQELLKNYPTNHRPKYEFCVVEE